MYFITVIENIDYDADPLYATKGDQRCMGYVETFEKAEEIVTNNSYDIHECSYDYAVIEKIGPGIHYPAFERQFYKYNYEKGTYERIEEPPSVKQIINFSIG